MTYALPPSHFIMKMVLFRWEIILATLEPGRVDVFVPECDKSGLQWG